MWSLLLHVLAKAFVRVWLATSAHSWRRLPRPADQPVVHSLGPDPDQLIVIGSGAVVGYGVLSYELSVSGQLAHLVSSITGRGVDMHIVAAPDLDVAAARATIATLELPRFNVIVLTIGPIDAITLVPSLRWRARLSRLLDEIAAKSPVSLTVLVTGIPSLPTLVTLPSAYRAAVGRRCIAFNDESAAVVAGRARVSFVPFAPPAINLVQNPSRQVHSDWAALLAPAVAAALEATVRPAGEQPAGGATP